MNRRLFLKRTFMESIPVLVLTGAGASSILNSCNGYSPEQARVKKPMPSLPDALDVKTDTSLNNPLTSENTIINEDTLSTASTVPYERPLVENYNRRRYCDIVAQNAEKHFPESRSFLETILKANHDYRNIFDIPVEYHIGLLYQESKFDPKAISYAPAVGIAQFMRATAKDMGIQVYDMRQFRELYDAETMLKDLNKESNKLWSKILSSVRSNDFDSVKSYKLEYDKIVTARGKYMRKAKAMYLDVLSGLDDKRLDPEVSLDKSAKYLSIMSRESQINFGGKHIHNILRGMAAYNSGFKNVKNNKGLPFIQETIGYVRNIMVNADKISPYQPDPQSAVYDANYQIISELITNKIYSLSDISTPRKGS